MIKIAPSILSADFSMLGDEIKRLDMGGADIIHIDVMDGHYVPNLTIGPLVVKAIRRITDQPFDVHLMMNNPMDYIDQFVDAGADNITVHAEVLPHLHRAIQIIKSKGIKASVALNPTTSLECLQYILEDIDMVLLMTVNPGFGGQGFIPSMIHKIKTLRNMCDEKNIPMDIQVDGGITKDNIGQVVSAGANIIVSGSSIFEANDLGNMIRLMKNEAAL